MWSSRYKNELVTTKLLAKKALTDLKRNGQWKYFWGLEFLVIYFVDFDYKIDQNDHLHAGSCT